MMRMSTTKPGQFCWLDLAATDMGRATTFYGELFGWQAQEQVANNGSFKRMRLSGQNVGSIYQLRNVQIELGMPSHWTSYIWVNDLDRVAQRVPFLGGKVVVRPFTVSGIARIALITDSVGAHVGLWEPVAAKEEVDRHEQGA